MATSPLCRRRPAPLWQRTWTKAAPEAQLSPGASSYISLNGERSFHSLAYAPFGASCAPRAFRATRSRALRAALRPGPWWSTPRLLPKRTPDHGAMHRAEQTPKVRTKTE